MARFIQGDRPEAGAELAMTGWKLARLFLGVALVRRALIFRAYWRQTRLRSALTAYASSVQQKETAAEFAPAAGWSKAQRCAGAP